MTETLTKPKEFIFDEKAHAYFLDGKPMFGTTTVLGVIAKPMLIGWAANMAVDYIIENSLVHGEVKIGDGYKSYVVTEDRLKEARTAHTKTRDKAGELGTDIHLQIEKLINAAIELNNGQLQEFMITEETPKQVKEFVQWAITKQVIFLVSEIRLYSESMWVAGTADFICLIGGKLYIGDIKTSSAIYDEHFYQGSAYAEMAREMGLYDNFHGVVIVNIPKRGGLNVKESYDLEGNLEVFKAALTIHKNKTARKINK